MRLTLNGTSEDLVNLRQLQASILDSASRLVKPGGRLLYATCSLLHSENEAQAIAFLDRHPEFSARELAVPDALESNESNSAESNSIKSNSIKSNSMLRMLSSKHETDGFFAAGFIRRAN